MTKPAITVVIATLNEWHGVLNRTIKSIRDGCGDHAEIIVVDDASSTRVRVDDPDVKVFHNRIRLGVGPARHIGVELASSDLILITDAHMIFPGGWLQTVMDTVLALPDTQVLCGRCLSLNENTLQCDGEYNGARMLISDDTAELRWRILTAKWAIDRAGQDFYRMSAVMGACYVMRKSWFFHIGGLKILRKFGCDEELLSIRTIRAGGSIRLCKQLKVGHIFRARINRPPYRITVEECLRNTIAVALTSCPAVEAQELIAKLGRSKEVVRAVSLISEDLLDIQQEQDRMASVLTMPWPKYLETIQAIDTGLS